MDRDNIMTLVVKIKEKEAKKEGKRVNHSSLLKRANLFITAMVKGSSFFTPYRIDSRTDEYLACLVYALMNRVRRIKAYVIDELWDGKKQGDEYNNLSKIVDNRIKTLINGHVYFEFFLAQYRSDEEIAALIIPLVNPGDGNKKMLFEVESSNGIKYSYSDLLLINEERKETWDVFTEEITEVLYEKGIIPDNILARGRFFAYVLLLSSSLLHARSPEKYKLFLFTMLNMNDALLEHLKKEVILSRSINRADYGIDNLQKYAFLTDAIFKYIFLYIILFEQDYCNSKSPLEALIKTLNETHARIDDVIKKTDRLVSVPLGKSYYNEMDILVLSARLIVYWDFKEYVSECEKITNQLSTESPPEGNNDPKSNSNFSEINAENIELYLCGNKRVPNFKEKLATVQSLLEYAKEHHNFYFDPRKAYTYKILFQELYVRKNATSPYCRCQARTIVKDLTKNKTNLTKYGEINKTTDPTDNQSTVEARREAASKEEKRRKRDISRRVFLDEKFTRGFFYENNKMDMYPQFLEARTLYRKCIQSILRIHDMGTACCEFRDLISTFLHFSVFDLSDRISTQLTDNIEASEFFLVLRSHIRCPTENEVKYFFPYERHLF